MSQPDNTNEVRITLDRSKAETFANAHSVVSEPQAFAFEAAQQAVKASIRDALAHQHQEGTGVGEAAVLKDRIRDLEDQRERASEEGCDDCEDRRETAVAALRAARLVLLDGLPDAALATIDAYFATTPEPQQEARLRGALEQLRNGPDTLTPDGLKIVLAALYPEQGGEISPDIPAPNWFPPTWKGEMP